MNSLKGPFLFPYRNTNEIIFTIQKYFRLAISVILVAKPNYRVTRQYFSLCKIQNILSVEYSPRKIYNLNREATFFPPYSKEKR